MQFLRTLIWVLVAGIVVAFSINNWVTVPIRLWAGLIADINLPLLMFLAFSIGFVPLFVYHVAGNWRMKSRLTNAERALADLRAANAAPPPAATTLTPEPIVDPIEPDAAPMRAPDPFHAPPPLLDPNRP